MLQNCLDAASGVSAGFHISMSECTAAFPDDRRRSIVRVRLASGSMGQSSARSMLPYLRMAGPM